MRPSSIEALRIPRASILALSILVLIPCFWQRTIQAGDLGSHIYNCWLTEQIELGKAPGLAIVPMTTNVLFDVILGALYRAFGALPAQRIAVSLAVLIFFWGAFALVWFLSAARPWFLTPCLLMWTYGWTFHMGFFNYYLAAGLSLWALALALRFGAPGLVAAGALLAIAYVGNALPPALAVGAMAYYWIAGKLEWRSRFVLLGAGLGGILAVRYWLMHRYSTSSTFHRFLEAIAVDQIWVFGWKYWPLSLCLALLWGFLTVTHFPYRRRAWDHSQHRISAVCSNGRGNRPAAFQHRSAAQPNADQLHQRTNDFAIRCIDLRFLARGNPPRWLSFAFVPLAVVYFSLIFVDTNAINQVEKRLEILTAGLSAQDRVFTSFEDPYSRVQLWAHNLDRACLVRCISYANYEPFTRWFRVRAQKQNPLVVADPLDFAALEAGGYSGKTKRSALLSDHQLRSGDAGAMPGAL